MLNRVCVRILRFCGMAVALWSVSAAAEIAIVSPSEGQVVPLLTEAQRAYVQTPRETREPWFADNKVKRAELRRIGSKPNPVRIAWTGADGQPVAVTVFKLPNRESVYSFSGRTNELAISNLEIARDYAVEVVAGADKASRRFRTEDLAPRFMDVPNIGNMRDLGGRVGLDGRRVKQGRIYRSAGWNSNAVWPTKKIKDKNGKTKKVADDSRSPVAGTNRLTSAGRDYALKVLDIRSDIDLRKGSECWGMTGSPIGPEVTWFHYSYLGYYETASAAGRKAFADVFRVLLDEKNYPLVFHCIGGADRTGTVAFILNALLGCAEEELYLDWEVTGFTGGVVDRRHRKWFLGLVRTIGKYEGANWSEKAASYVRACGFTDDDIAKFRSMMLEDPAVPTARPAAQPTLIAHQGLHGNGVPGNTVEAIAAAFSNGWMQVETDFWRLKDGSFACMHDPKSGARLKKPYHVPSLDEVLACVPTNGVLQCEIKDGYGEAYAMEFEAAVRRAGLGPKQITVSGNAKVLADFHKRYPIYRTIWLLPLKTDFPRELDRILKTARKAGISAICPCGRAEFPTTFTREHADRIRAAGFDVCLWGVHTPEKLAFAREVGAVAVTTDCPASLQK